MIAILSLHKSYVQLPAMRKVISSSCHSRTFLSLSDYKVAARLFFYRWEHIVDTVIFCAFRKAFQYDIMLYLHGAHTQLVCMLFNTWPGIGDFPYWLFSKQIMNHQLSTDVMDTPASIVSCTCRSIEFPNMA